MRRILIGTTALAVALSGPLPVVAQTTITVRGQEVVCLPNKKTDCPDGAMCVIAKNEKNCRSKARNQLDQAAGESPAEVITEEAITEEAQTDPEAAEVIVLDETPAQEEPEKIRKPRKEKQAEGEAIVVETEGAGQETPLAEVPVGEAVVQDVQPQDVVIQDAAPAEEPRKKKKRKAEAVTEEQLITLVDPAQGAEAPTTEQIDVLTGILDEDPAAGAASPEEVVLPEALAGIDGAETPVVGGVGGAPVVVEGAGSEGAQGGETPVKKKKKKKQPVVIDVTDKDVRKSDEDFAEEVIIGGETPVEKKKSDKGMSDLEKFGLAVVGALVVGAVLNNGNKVVSNTGDRVVVQQPDGQYVVLKDDDTLIRRPGSNVQTETFDDGSTRTVVSYGDGSRIVTIRDAAGRVLLRSRYDAQGREVRLIDDTVPVDRIDVTKLPSRPGRVIGGANDDLAAALASLEAEDLDRRFSLRQIREYPQVRALAPELNVERVTFATGSAAIRASEAEKLRELGLLMARMVKKNPAELFLIEGHTDAVGNGGYNLSLSDRRAESLALALTEYFGVPPENMVVQGYGESELLVEVAGDEPRNRRTAVRQITGLLARAN